MSLKESINKFRQWDNKIAKWITQNMYYTFFHFVILIVLFCWTFNTIETLIMSQQIKNSLSAERILILQSLNLNMITFLLLLNSFWILYLLNNSHRMKNSLRNISYNTTPKYFNKNRNKQEQDEKD